MKDIYIDVDVNVINKQFFVMIFVSGERHTIKCKLSNFGLLASYIKNVFENNKSQIYLDKYGYGLALADKLDELNVKYSFLECKKGITM